MQCWDSNPQPLEHESPPITSRPRLGLLKKIFLYKKHRFLLDFSRHHVVPYFATKLKSVSGIAIRCDASHSRILSESLHLPGMEVISKLPDCAHPKFVLN